MIGVRNIFARTWKSTGRYENLHKGDFKLSNKGNQIFQNITVHIYLTVIIIRVTSLTSSPGHGKHNSLLQIVHLHMSVHGRFCMKQLHLPSVQVDFLQEQLISSSTLTDNSFWSVQLTTGLPSFFFSTTTQGRWNFRYVLKALQSNGCLGGGPFTVLYKYFMRGRHFCLQDWTWTKNGKLSCIYLVKLGSCTSDTQISSEHPPSNHKAFTDLLQSVAMFLAFHNKF